MTPDWGLVFFAFVIGITIGNLFGLARLEKLSSDNSSGLTGDNASIPPSSEAAGKSSGGVS